MAIIEQIPDHVAENLTYRYCTEALIKGTDLDGLEIRKRVESHGDSIVVAGTSKLSRVHIHTNAPETVMQDLRPMGTLAFQKVEDMHRQYAAAYERKWSIALVTDSACDLPEELVEKYQVHLVPLNLFVGENQYLDKRTIKPGQFYEMLEEVDVPISTSQPSEKSFINLYSQLLTHMIRSYWFTFQKS